MKIDKRRKWTDSEIEFLKENYPKYGSRFCSEKINIGYLKVKAKISRLKLKRNSRQNLNKLLSESLESFYWIGFLLADGNFNSKTGYVRLRLSVKDVEHVKKFTQFVEADEDRIKFSNYYTPLTKKENNIARVQFFCANTIKKLCEIYDIQNNKTTNSPDIEKFKHLNINQLTSMIIGFIDGDGSINNTNGRSSIKIKTHKNWFHFLNLIKDGLSKFYGEELNCNVRVNKQSYAEISIGDLILIKTLKYFLLNNKLPVLTRKWNKVDLNRKSRIETFKKYKANPNKNLILHSNAHSLELERSV